MAKANSTNKVIEDMSDVCIIGAGPAGLMLADNLARFGVKSEIIDQEATSTKAGKADGLQPKTIETLRMLRLADDLIRVGTKVYDICIWGRHEDGQSLRRLGREMHYPEAIVDVLDPYILLCHQGMVEGVLIKAMKDRGVEVRRSTTFEHYETALDGKLLDIKVRANGLEMTIKSKYLVGCDGAHSKTRKAIPGAAAVGSSSEDVWGVLDGLVETDFPDIWSKTIVFHHKYGSVLIIPRERGMTRLYIELKRGEIGAAELPSGSVAREIVMERAKQICSPFRLEWKTVEWFGCYRVGQRVANKFMDEHNKRVFIAGDACHTHSPKAAQGMNTSIHDSWNLAWKLNLAIRGLAKSALLESYETERKKIAHDLINFDYEHANKIAGRDSEALAENLRTNIRFISGVGVEYGENALNKGYDVLPTGLLKPGTILPPAKAIRYIDHNPVDLQLDIPVLGQFKIYVLLRNVTGLAEQSFLSDFSHYITASPSFIARSTSAARESYAKKPRLKADEDAYFCHERYISSSDLFTFALITTTEKTDFELEQLPHLFSRNPWTVYLDSPRNSVTQAQRCTDKWLGNIGHEEVAIVNVRPDNYVGSVSKWHCTDQDAGTQAAVWLDSYFSEFLQV